MKRTIYMIFLITAALVLGSFMGNMVIGTEGLNWLSYGKTFALDPGGLRFLDFLSLDFGISLSINIAQIILIVTAIIVYTKTAPKIFTS